MSLTNDQITAKNFKAIVDGLTPFLGAKTQTISESAFEQLSQAEKDNGTAYFVPDATAVTNFMVMGNRFDKANIYTTTERMVGAYLGKPLYQKVVEFTEISGNGNSWINTSATLGSDIDIIVNSYAISSAKRVYPCTVDISGSNNLALMHFRTTSVGFTKCVIQYTKTSDAQVNIGTGNDYSTDEQIIGTWIDGKPLYQKTISLGNLPNASSKDVPLNITNLDTIWDMHGIGYFVNSGTTYNISLPLISTNSASIITISRANDVIRITTGQDRSHIVGYVTIQYTKTGD